VLDAALIVLTSKGFEAFTVSEVAERAGVHETSIYRRWGTRTSLALEACLRFADEALPIPDTGSLRSDLIELLKSVTQLLKSPQGQALLSVSMSIDPEIITVRKTYWKARFALASKIFERASTRGEFPAGASGDELLEALIAPLYFRSFVTIAPLEDWPTSEMIDRLFASYKA
jgi:AcrR family transcriptional regulator